MVRTWIALLCAVLFIGPSILSSRSETAPNITATAMFCESETFPPTDECSFTDISFPHNWSPSRKTTSLGVYRIILPRPPDGDYAVLIDRMSLDGAVEVNGQRIIDRLDPDHITRQRYWPLMGRFTIGPSDGETLILNIVTRGHSQTKNGLGRVRLAGIAEGERLFRRDLVLDVITVAAVAAAGLLAGTMGLLIGDRSNRTGRVLTATSWLSIVASARCIHNLVTDPPFDPASWLAIGTWLLIMIALQAIIVVQTYLKPEAARGWVHALTTAGLLAIVWLAGSMGAMGPATTLLFIALILFAAHVLVRLIIACLKAPDPLGWAILLVFAIILATGVHDLAMHLGRASLSDGYLQGWALPVVIILSVLALARRAAEQRQLEEALRRSDSRREDLIRDLHDRVGSRLVALAFHAQQYDRNPALVEEVRDLISEVRMMQNAVASDATTLDALLADLRHLYSRVGGGRLPIDWRIQETVERIDLGPDKVIAVARIIEEAIANAIRHAAPSRIVIRLIQETAGSPVRVEVENDGIGTIRPAPSGGGGLNNMRARAEAAGLNLDFVNAAETRSVRISFPIRRLTPSSAISRSLRCQIRRTLRLDPKGSERRRG
ncbi:MAG: hypothetical protein KGS00_09450 [Alphaproteobacteria bacterium]|nr:hypothetical protein [Alphaproteobacteria bacterium]